MSGVGCGGSGRIQGEEVILKEKKGKGGERELLSTYKPGQMKARGRLNIEGNISKDAQGINQRNASERSDVKKK